MIKRVDLSGPTSFAPIIRKSIEIIEKNRLSQSKMVYHILIIIADGNVSAEHEEDTAKAIADASNYPLSIVIVGVGDGPWDTMIKYDERLNLNNKFDNIQFVDYHNVTVRSSNKNADNTFALNALMEIPEQYKLMKQLNYI